MKKSNKKSENRPASKSEIRQIIGVAVEHLDDKISLVAEQYGDIKNTLEEHTRILAEHTELIGNIMTEIRIIKEDYAAMRENYVAMKADMDIMKTDIEFIKFGLKKKVDIEEFAALERRVALLEKRRVSRQ